QEHVARQLVQVDMAEFADLVLDNTTFFLAHGRGTAVHLMTFEDPVDGRRRRYCIAPLAQVGMDLIAVHAPPPAGDDLGLDALRLTALPPFRPAALRQQVGIRPAGQVSVVILAERLRAGAVMAVEIPDPPERRRSTRFHCLIFCHQETPPLNVIAFNRPVKAVVAHRIPPARMDSISELVNMHSNDATSSMPRVQDAARRVCAYSRARRDFPESDACIDATVTPRSVRESPSQW